MRPSRIFRPALRRLEARATPGDLAGNPFYIPPVPVAPLYQPPPPDFFDDPTDPIVIRPVDLPPPPPYVPDCPAILTLTPPPPPGALP